MIFDALLDLERFYTEASNLQWIRVLSDVTDDLPALVLHFLETTVTCDTMCWSVYCRDKGYIIYYFLVQWPTV